MRYCASEYIVYTVWVTRSPKVRVQCSSETPIHTHTQRDSSDGACKRASLSLSLSLSLSRRAIIAARVSRVYKCCARAAAAAFARGLAKESSSSSSSSRPSRTHTYIHTAFIHHSVSREAVWHTHGTALGFAQRTNCSLPLSWRVAAPYVCMRIVHARGAHTSRIPKICTTRLCASLSRSRISLYNSSSRVYTQSSSSRI